MIWFFRFLFGYVRVLFYGECPEKILNSATGNRMFLWDTHLSKKGLETCMSVRDFKGIRTIIRGSGLRIHILKKHGLPFVIFKNRKRSGFVIGILLLFILLKFMSGYIWIIDVTGNERVKTEEIITALKKIGIYEGISQTAVEPKTQREKLLLEIDTLAWASLNVEGCRLTVNVSEIKNEKPKDNTPSNLKAAADGVIKKIDVNSGNCIVKQGDTVKEGDILVSGIIERLGSTEFVRSSGTVIAATERSITVSEKYKQKIISENGNNKKKCVLEFFSVKIPLYLGKENRNYNSELKSNVFTLFSQKLPIIAHKREFRYTDEYYMEFSKDKLLNRLEKEVGDELNEKNVRDYTVIAKNVTEKTDGITLNVIVTSEENIAVSEDLLISVE